MAYYDKKTGEEIRPFGYELNPDGTPVRGTPIDTSKPGDYGADPLGDGLFRMVPSGDIVDAIERQQRLSRR